MATIAFVMDTEEGHIIPSFGLARSLMERGHSVVFLSILDNEELVLEHGFKFKPIFEKIYYKGYRNDYKKLSPPPGLKRNNLGALQELYSSHVAALMNGAFDDLISDLQADLFIVSTFLHTDLLILYYKYNISPVIFTPFLREKGHTAESDCFLYLTDINADAIVGFIDFIDRLNINLTSMRQIAEPLNTFCELSVCPREIDIDMYEESKNVHHIGPSIRKSAYSPDVRDLFGIQEGRKIIYASLGSQPVRHSEACKLFFANMINVMKQEELRNSHLILSVGPEFEMESLGPISKNVTVVRWAPQIDVLKLASLAIIHGGMGTIKECIYYGIPMIVLPLGYDQPLNAKRIEHHKLGLQGDIKTLSAGDLKALMVHVLANEEIGSSVKRMQKIFLDKEEACLGVDIIEGLLEAKKADVLTRAAPGILKLPQ